jgi:hypothetical protein
VAGLNTLTITMTSSDNFLEAVRLEGHVEVRGPVVPEPSTLLAALSFAAVAVVAIGVDVDARPERAPGNHPM